MLKKQPPEVFHKKKVFFKVSQNSQENNCARVSFLINLQAFIKNEACNFIKKEALAQVLSCEFSKFFKNTFSTEDLQTTTSVVNPFHATSPFLYPLKTSEISRPSEVFRGYRTRPMA